MQLRQELPRISTQPLPHHKKKAALLEFATPLSEISMQIHNPRLQLLLPSDSRKTNQASKAETEEGEGAGFGDGDGSVDNETAD